MTPGVDVVVLGRRPEVPPLAGAAAVLLAGRAAGLVLTTAAGARTPVRGLPAAAAARRLRDRLRRVDLDAQAAGRVVWCAVDDGSVDAALAAGAGVPVVLAIAGPRGAWTEPLLDGAHIVLVAGTPADPLTALALAEVRSRGLAAEAVGRLGGTSAVLARAGLPGGPRWEPGLHAALEGVS